MVRYHPCNADFSIDANELTERNTTMSQSMSGAPSWWVTIGMITLAAVITLILAALLTALTTMIAFLLSFLLFIVPQVAARVIDLVLFCLAGFIGGALAGNFAYRIVLASTLPQATWWAWVSALVWGVSLIPFWYDFLYHSQLKLM
jgi:hypothetical protein